MKLLSTAACVAVLSMGSMASAASWDFAADAETFFNVNGYEGTFDQVYGVGGDVDLGGAAGGDAAAAGTLGGNTDGGITVNASGLTHPSAENQDPHPFMDSRGKNDGDDVAGLGVCSSGFLDSGISDCSTNFGDNTGDDNLVFPEILGLTFSDAVWLTELFIRDAHHDPENGSMFVATSLDNAPGEDHPALVELFIVDGVVTNPLAAGFSSTFYFTSSGTAPGQEIYLSTLSAQVPVPAAGFLLLGGLGGLVAMKRRKKA